MTAVTSKKLAGKVASDGRSKLRIGFVLARSFTLSPFALFVDVLRLASDTGDKSGRVHADWQVLSSTQHLIKSSCGVSVAPTSDLVDPGNFDYIVVVGGLLKNDAAVDEQTINYLKSAAARRVPLIGVCTGTFILAEAGLMKQHQTCVSWLHYQTFRERFPDHDVRADRIFNIDRNLGSCAGGSSAADLAAFIVKKYIGNEAEKNALEVLQIERARSTHEIQPRRPLGIECLDDRLQAAMIMMENNIEYNIPLVKIAKSIGMSRRHLERLFKEKTNTSPALVYKQIRLNRAKYLLSKTKNSVTEIALDVGFENAAVFAKQFKKTFSQSPIKFRMAHFSKMLKPASGE